MSDIERKVSIDTENIKKADKEYRQFSDQTEKEQQKQTREQKKQSKRRLSNVRVSIASQVKEVRKLSRERIEQLNLALKQNEISEKQPIKKVVAIRKKANKDIQQSRKSESGGKKGGGSFGGLGSLLTKLPLIGKVAAGVAILGKGLASLAAPALKAEARLEAFNQRAKVVFGDTLPLVELAASQTAASLGLTEAAFLGVTGATADLLVPLGATREQAAEMSIDTLNLAAALKQFNGDQRTTAEVSEVLTKAYLGERDGLKSLGISIDEAAIKQELLKRGTQGLTGEALQLEKALITQELLIRKSADAQASYAESSDNTQTKMNELSAAWDELASSANSVLAAIFKPFLVILAGIIKGINATIGGTKKLLNIGSARAKGQQQEILLVAKLSKELKKLRKVGSKSTAQIKRQAAVVDQLGAALENVGVKNGSLIKDENTLASLSKKKIADKKTEIMLEIAQGNAAIAVAKQKIQAFKAQSARDVNVRQRNAILIKNRQKQINDTKIDNNVKRNTLKLLNSIGKASKKISVATPKISLGGGGKTKKAAKPEFEAQDTSLEELTRQEDAIEQALINTESGLRREALLKQQARIDEQFAIQENFVEIDSLETERRTLQENLFYEKNKQRQKELKEELKQNAIRIKIEKDTAKEITNIRQKQENIRAAIQTQATDLGLALISQEEGAFKKFLANKLRELTRYIAGELALKAKAAIFTGNIGAAALLTAGAVAVTVAGEAGAQEIERSINKSENGAGFDPTAARDASTIAPVTNQTINNIDNSTKIEVIETGTYFTESQMIRDRIDPLLKTLESSRGTLVT